MRRSTLAIILALVAAAGASAVTPAAAVAGEGLYCNEIVPPHTDCATSPGHSWDWWNGDVFYNAAQYFGEGTVSVCEHTYRRSNGETVSNRCKNGVAGSEGDLEVYYNLGIELSSHSGNNSEHNHTIVGSVFF